MSVLVYCTMLVIMFLLFLSLYSILLLHKAHIFISFLLLLLLFSLLLVISLFLLGSDLGGATVLSSAVFYVTSYSISFLILFVSTVSTTSSTNNVTAIMQFFLSFDVMFLRCYHVH